jgi:hypothetical protein
LCKIEYLLGEYQAAMTHALEADRFFQKMWTNACADALFWLSLSAFRAGRHIEATDAARQLARYRPGYSKLDKLLELVGGKQVEDEA